MAIILLYLALLAGAFFFLIVRPQRRQMAARRALIASIEVGDEVITAGGIYGTVLEVTDTTLLVQVAPGVELTLAREAVSSRPPSPVPEVPDTPAALDAGDEPGGSPVDDAAGIDPPEPERGDRS
jgi:preprotein translocase subunit YajC